MSPGVLLVLVLGAEPKPPPLPSPLAHAVFTADAIVEFEAPLDPKLKPEQRWRLGLSKARPTRVVASRALLETPPEVTFKPFDVLRSCLSRTNGRTSVKFLLVAGGNPLSYSLLPMTTLGFGLESTPGYAELVAAIVEAFTWREERMRAVGAEQLWLAERKALVSDNPALRHLAAEWLVQHDAAAVVDEAWGAPGTESRAREEAAASVAPRCH